MYDVSGVYLVNVMNKLLMSQLNVLEKEMIVYKVLDEKYVIIVFIDIICGYCYKLYEEMKDYNVLGIMVCYLVFLCQGLESQVEQDMKFIWCVKDKNKVFDDVMVGKGVKLVSCDVNIVDYYVLGVQLGVSGMLVIVLSNGYVVSGYQGLKEMKVFFDEY